MVDLAQLAGTAAGGSVVTLIGQALIAWVKGGSDADQHREKLTFELLEAAREEVKLARQEVAELRPVAARLAHFEEALDHIEALRYGGEVARRAATIFLRRFRPERT